jgi:hypothetical protein
VYEHLRNSPVYQNALRAPSAFALYPANWMKKKHLWPDHRVQTAAIRLDHLIHATPRCAGDSLNFPATSGVFEGDSVNTEASAN